MPRDPALRRDVLTKSLEESASQLRSMRSLISDVSELRVDVVDLDELFEVTRHNAGIYTGGFQQAANQFLDAAVDRAGALPEAGQLVG
jgi:hypothetical protein